MSETFEDLAKTYAFELNSKTDTSLNNEIYVSGTINEDFTDGEFSVRLNEITNRVNSLNYYTMANLLKLLLIKTPNQNQPIVHWPGIGNIRFCHIADEIRPISYFRQLSARRKK